MVRASARSYWNESGVVELIDGGEGGCTPYSHCLPISMPRPTLVCTNAESMRKAVGKVSPLSVRALAA